MGVAKVIRDFAVRFGIDADTKSVDVFDKRVDRAKANLNDLAGFAIRATAAVVGFGAAIAVQATQTANYAAQVERSAGALALTTDEFQELSAVAERFDGDASDVADIFGTLADRANDAESGMQSFVDDFRIIGIEVEDLKGKDPQGLFNLFADAIKDTEDPNKRLTAAVRILGDDVGNKFLPALIQGSEGLNRMRQEAHETGKVLDKDAIAAAARGAAQFRILGQVVQGLRNEIGLALIPVVSRAAKGIVGWVQSNRELIRQRIEEAVEKIEDAYEALLVAIEKTDDFVRENLGGWPNLFAKIALGISAAGVAKVLVTIGSVLSALQAGVAAVASAFSIGFAPALVLIAAFVAQLAIMFLIFEDLGVFFLGGRSVIGSYFERFGEGNTIMDAHVRLVRSLKPLWESVLGLFVKISDSKFGQFLGAVAAGLFDVAAGFFDLQKALTEFVVVGFFSLLLDGLVQVVDLTTQAIEAWTKFFEGDIGFQSAFSGTPLGKILGFAPTADTAAGGGSTTTNSVSQGATTIMVSGTGNPEEVARRVDEQIASRNRAALNGLQAGPR